MLKKLYDEDDIRIAVTIEAFYQSKEDEKLNKVIETYDDLIRLMEDIHKAYIEEYDELGFSMQGYIQEFACDYLDSKRYLDRVW